MVFRSDSLGVKPSSVRLSDALATSTGGSPSRLGAFEIDKLSPVSAPMASSTCFNISAGQQLLANIG